MPQLIQTVEKSAFQDADTIEVDMVFEARASNGAVQRMVVRKVEGDQVTIDANHPLAGLALNFDVEVVGV